MLVTNPMLTPPIAAWLTCTCDGAPVLTTAFMPGAGDNLWPMIALIGAAAILMGIFQAFRRKPGTAILALFCGAGLLGLFAAFGQPRPIRGALTINFVGPPRLVLPAGPGQPVIVVEPSRSGDITAVVTQQEILEQRIDALGAKFRKMRSKELDRRLRDDRTVLGFSELQDSAHEARQQALQDVAGELRRRLRDHVAPHTKLPVGAKLDEHAAEIEDLIVGILEGLADSAHVGIVTREFGSPQARRHRTAVRVDPEQVVQEISSQVSEFFDTKVAPWMVRAVRTTLTMLALGILVYLAFVFVDSGTRGHFTWTLRIAAAVAFVGMCGALWYLVP